MKTPKLFVLLLLLVLAALSQGCSSGNSEAPSTSAPHPANWVSLHGAVASQDLSSCQGCHGSDFKGSGQAVSCFTCHTAGPPFVIHPTDWIVQHGAAANTDLASCQRCHGADFTGSGAAVSCFSCHSSGPPFLIHPSSWVNGPLEDHKCFFNVADSSQRLSWTTCATAACHGTTLQGGLVSQTSTGPSCFSSSFTDNQGLANSCHSSGPPAPHTVGGAYADPANHGADAKDPTNVNNSMGNYCINCHGRPTNQFDGGFVADPAILNVAAGNCSTCHTDATAHPTNWVRADNATHYHSTVSDQTISESCALCHNTVAQGAGPFAGAPSCFSSSFTNPNGLTNSCHATGPGGAPHAVPFTDPALHGPVAKANLIYCQGCHGTSGGAGSNPRFNVPIGNLVNGCEDCHAAGTAHPTGTNRWTFHYDPNTTRRTHFAAGNVTTACALCHNVSASDTGGNAPACTGCHVAPAAPNFKLNCTACHGTPPDGAADDTGSPTPVAHGAVAGVSLHETCSICHGASDDGTGQLAAKSADYQLFNANSTTLNQGGDHLDGQIEMNGPTTVGAGYNATNFGCDIACHGNDTNHRLPNGSGLTVAYGNYGTGSAGCNACHGYPPDGSADIAPVPVSHLFNDNGAALLSNHNDCAVCHGDKDDGTGSHSPVGAYNVATDHATGSININADTQYNTTNHGCDAACHANDAAHQFPNASGFPIVTASYGSGGGAGSCSACHDTGVGGAPVVVQNTSSHASVFTCEDCHTGHSQGTVVVPNNTQAGINYSATGHPNGIDLGGAATTGTTEAEICWNCHANYSISEWGVNTDTNGTASNYDFGTLSQTNWVGATWTSANFAYKTGAIQSTHAANFAAVGPGMDAVGDIHCSYCHDVHNVGAQGFRNGYDNGSSPPYLMGTWMGNPYREDGAPQAGTNYPSNANGRFGAVPRPGTQATTLGGYQIDQNNGNPTSGWTANGSAGLCEACHGNGDGNWTATEIDNLNMFGTASTDWVGTNGHSNAVLGGSGANATNIFAMSIRNPSGAPLYTTNGEFKGQPRMAYGNAGAITQGTAVSGQGTGSYRGYGLRSQNSSGYRMAPQVTNSEPYAYRYYNWGASIDDTLDIQFHQFSCSKCHNPHASRLPRLMITNCLDTKHNTWDDSHITPTTTTLAVENRGVPLSNATSAQNCHRLADPNYSNTTGNGWNNVTPW